MRRVVVIEGDFEVGEILEVACIASLDELFGRNAILTGANHDGRAVGIIGADIDAFVALHFLEAGPEVGLEIFDEMAEMDIAIGIGKGRSDYDTTF